MALWLGSETELGTIRSPCSGLTPYLERLWGPIWEC